jgi:hypothetical protein
MYQRFEAFPMLSSGVSESLAPLFAGNACVHPMGKKSKPTAKFVLADCHPIAAAASDDEAS